MDYGMDKWRVGVLFVAETRQYFAVKECPELLWKPHTSREQECMELCLYAPTDLHVMTIKNDSFIRDDDNTTHWSIKLIHLLQFPSLYPIQLHLLQFPSLYSIQLHLPQFPSLYPIQLHLLQFPTLYSIQLHLLQFPSLYPIQLHLLQFPSLYPIQLHLKQGTLKNSG